MDDKTRKAIESLLRAVEAFAAEEEEEIDPSDTKAWMHADDDREKLGKLARNVRATMKD